MFALLAAFGLDIFAKRFLIAAATITAFILVFTAFNAVLESIILSLDLNSIPDFLLTGFKVLPSNTNECISIIITTKFTSLLYEYQLRVIDYRRS